MKLRTMFLVAVTALVMTGVSAVYAEQTPAGPKTAKPEKAATATAAVKEEAEKILKKYDKDGDGKLSEAEAAEAKKDKVNEDLIKALSVKKDAKKADAKK